MSGLRSAGWLRRCERCGGIIWPWQRASPPRSRRVHCQLFGPSCLDDALAAAALAYDSRPRLSGRTLYEKTVKELGVPDPIPFDMLPAPRRATLALLETEIAWDNLHRRTHP